MKGTFNLIFILLTTISIVNAVPYRLHKRATTFAKCPIDNPPLLNVKLAPDPLIPGQNANFDISGTLAQAATTGSLVGIGFFGSDQNFIEDPVFTTVCSLSGITCPVTEFSAILQISVPAALPTSYTIIIIITQGSTYLACASGIVTNGALPASGSTVVTSSPTPVPASSGVSAAPSGTTLVPTSSTPVAASPTSPSAGGPGNGPGGIQDALSLIVVQNG